MRITITLPTDVEYQGTREWVLDGEGDGKWWTVADLCADVAHAVKSSPLSAAVGEAVLNSADIAIEVLSDEDVVTFTKE
jgi:hypothetical protein